MRSFPGVLGLLLIAIVLTSCGGGGASGGGDVPEPPPTPPTAVMTILHNFRPDMGDGGQPNGPLLQATDGYFYGTTRAGGRHACRFEIGCGVIFRMTADGQESVLYHFGSTDNDGSMPSGPLIQGRDGALFGLTFDGGDHGGGTIFKVSLNGTYQRLHSFGGTSDDGVVPVGGLIQATDGNFYGVTASGGAHHCFQIPQDGGNCGTVFRMTPSGNTTTLYSFGNSISDGVTPNGPLVQASDGHLYGTTVNGGANACTTSNESHNCGTLFRTKLSGETTVLYSFGHSHTDAIAPQGPLIQGTDRALYGTTASGGGGSCLAVFGCGTVFRFSLAGEFSILHAFALESRKDGYGPTPYLIQARDGNFYGETRSGGEHLGDLNGTAFKLTPAGVLTTLVSFGPLNSKASNPDGGLMQARDGKIYGVLSYSDASSGDGSVYKLVLP